MPYIIVFFLLICLPTQAQEMLWSTPQKITNSTYYTNVLGQNHGGIYYFQTSKSERDRHILVTALKSDMRLKARKEFLQNKYESMEKLLLFDNWLGLIYSIKDKKEGTIKIMAKMLDPDLGEIVEDKLLYTKNTFNQRNDLIKVFLNRDRKSFIISIANSDDSLNNNLDLLLFDDNCILRKEEKLVIDFGEKFELSRHRFVDNKYFSVLKYDVKEGILKKNSRKILIEKDIATGNLLMHELYTDDFVTNKGLFSYDNMSKSYNFTSFYYREDTTKPIGFFQYQIFTQADSAKQRILAFHPIFMDEVFGRVRSDNDLKTLYLMKNIKRTDGGDIFICERKEIDEQQLDDVSIYGAQQTYVRYYYYFYEISILSINPDGSLDWHKVIKKEQISLNDEGYYSSFGCKVASDKLYFVYNDLSRKSSNVMIYGVNPIGQGEGHILMKGNELDGYAIPKESIQISTTEFLVPIIKLREGFTILKIKN